MRSLPTGTVTFLYTDIEGSTRLWQHAPDSMPAALDRHNAILQDAIDTNHGVVFRTVGDAYYASFVYAADAVAAALAAQRGLRDEPWPEDCVIRVRMAIHTGTAEVQNDDYVGHALNRVARLLSAGHGGQTLLSGAAEELARDSLPAGASVVDLGEHRLKDLIRPERIYQLEAPDVPHQFAPLVTIDTRPTNLPVQVTPFIGREREIETVVAMLRQPEVRLLSLTGAGGTGKTRLALQAGAELLEDFADGIFFVPLGQISDSDRVPSAIAEALDVKEAADKPAVDTLRAYLRERSLLLILDNFEQVLDAADCVSSLLGAGSAVMLLITSRSVLRISGEREYAVPTLSMPDPARLPDLRTLSQYDAVALFIDRARSVKPDFEVTNDNAPSVAAICHRLDGLPLAIELAAARIRLFPPRALLGRLQNRLQILTGGPRDLPARQQTLRGAIDWSYSLLSPEDQRLFARLSVFSGGCTFEGAEAICNPGGDLDLLNGIASLVEKSLLRQQGEEEPRFVMLETIREYAAERLAERGEAESIRDGHATYFAAQAAEADRAYLHGTTGGAWLDRVSADQDNVRAALSWSLKQGNTVVALGLAATLAGFWAIKGLKREAQDWLAAALDAAGPDDSSVEYGNALRAMGSLHAMLGKYAVAISYLERSVRTLERYGETEDLALSLFFLGISLPFVGRSDDTVALMGRAKTIAERAADRVLSMMILNSLAMAAAYSGDPVGARQYLEDAIHLARDYGAPVHIVHALNALGDVSRMEGKYDEAEHAYREALRLSEERDLAGVRPSAVSNLAWVACSRGEAAEAIKGFQCAIEEYREMVDERGVAEASVGLGAALARRRPADAALLFASARAALDRLGVELYIHNQMAYERALKDARSATDEKTWDRVWQVGTGMALDDAINSVWATLNTVS